MACGADDCKAAGILHLLGELDIRTTACHVGGDCHLPLLTSLGHDFSFTGMLLCIEDVGLDAAHGHHAGKQLRSFNVRGTNQHRTSGI